MTDFDKWWKDSNSKEQVVNFLENASLGVLNDTTLGDPIKAIKLMQDFIEKVDKLGTAGKDANATALTEYLKILVYNYSFEISPEIAKAREFIRTINVELTRNHMASYAKHVSELTKALDVLGINEKDEVLDTLTALRAEIKVSEMLTNSALISGLVDRAYNDVKHDVKTVCNSLGKGYLCDEVDSALNHLH